MPQLERREALPAHPVPAGLAAPDAWRLRVDGLVTQPIELSVSEVEALGAQAHAADFVCEEGWVVPDQQWEGVAVAAILERAVSTVRRSHRSTAHRCGWWHPVELAFTV